MNVMKHIVLTILFGIFTVAAPARLFNQVDPTKQADIGNRVIETKDIEFNSVTSPLRSTTAAPLSKGDLKMKGVELKGADLKTLDSTFVPMNTLPQQNFSAKRAAADGKVRDEKTIKHEDARIKDRQFRPFTPKGEEELKEQFRRIP